MSEKEPNKPRSELFFSKLNNAQAVAGSAAALIGAFRLEKVLQDPSIDTTAAAYLAFLSLWGMIGMVDAVRYKYKHR